MLQVVTCRLLQVSSVAPHGRISGVGSPPILLRVLQNVNYPGLRALVKRHGSQGFNVIAFPCNQARSRPLSRLSCVGQAAKLFKSAYPCASTPFCTT